MKKASRQMRNGPLESFICRYILSGAARGKTGKENALNVSCRKLIRTARTHIIFGAMSAVLLEHSCEIRSHQRMSQ